MTESQLLESMAMAMYYAICHYHPECTWEKAHPETRNMYLKQAKAGYDAIGAYVTLGGGGVSDLPEAVQAEADRQGS